MEPFLTLDDVLLWPPLASLVSVLVVAGIWWAGDYVAQRIWRSPDRVERAAGFVVALAALAALINGLALSQFVPLWLLRSIAGVLICLGIVRIYVLSHRPIAWPADIARHSALLPRVCFFLGAAMVIALWLAALGPATDADSLDYHLGVPLDWLRHGGAYAREDWLHARLVGVGESVNLLGLASGTDNLGALVQWSGLLVAWLAVLSLASEPKARALGSLLVLACPLLLFLVPNQKPQLFPAAAIVLAMILLTREATPSRRTLAVAVVAVAYAISNKYSFLLSGGVVLAYGMWKAHKAGRSVYGIVVILVAIAVLPGPNLLRNLIFYGDPISPFLERFLPGGKVYVVEFGQYLRSTGGGIDFERIRNLPLEWMVSPNLLVASNVLGVGLLAFVTIGRPSGASKALLICAAAIVFTVLMLGQVTARFVFEAYLMVAAAVVATGWNRRKQGFLYLLIGQSVLVLLMGIYTGGTLFPGSFSRAMRDAVMEKTAYHYSATRWLDRILPDDVVLSTYMRVNALMPRPFRASDEISFTPAEERVRRVEEVEAKGGRVVFVEHEQVYRSLGADYPHCVRRVLGGPEAFPYASRNPLARRRYGKLSWIALELDPTAKTCSRTD